MLLFHSGQGLTETKLPSEFNSLLPLYDTAVVSNTRYTRNSATVNFTTDDAFTKVKGYYTDILKQADWRIIGSKGEQNLVASKGKVRVEISKNTSPQGFNITFHYLEGRE